MGPGWAKIVRMVAATISDEPLGTWARMLRRKCTSCRPRHKVHYADLGIMPTSRELLLAAA
jgi:hypothetical protein